MAMFALVLLISCNKDDAIDPSFNTGMEGLGFFSQPAELSEPEVIGTSDPEQDPGNPSFECYTQMYRAAPGFDEMLALDPTTDVIYPGAMLLGSSIPTGEYIPINGNRAPITLSISLQNLSGNPVIQVDDPKLSTVREGIKSILDQDVNSATPAKINFEIAEVYSEQHLNVALGANYRSAGTSVSSAFNFNQSNYSHKYVLKYLQVYYTIDMDAPTNPADLFKTTPNIDDFGSTAPCYVASMAYGRMVLYTIETNRSATEVNAAFSASFASSDGNIAADYKKTINESNIKALVIGGSGASAAQAINGPADVYAFISTGGNYSKDSPGAPLSYKLRYIKKGTPVARVVLTSEYNVRTCDLAYPSYKLKIDHVKCKDCPEIGDPEIYGRLTARAYVDGVAKNPKVEWSRTKNNPLEVKDNVAYSLGTTDNVQLYRPNYNTDYIKVDGWIKEYDGASDDDDFGSDSDQIELNSLEVMVPYSVTLKFDGRVEAKFTITRLE
jgi:thiol-activated cytolysin